MRVNRKSLNLCVIKKYFAKSLAPTVLTAGAPISSNVSIISIAVITRHLYYTEKFCNKER